MKDHSNRRWFVIFDLAYDCGGHSWHQYYRTKIGALISIFWNKNIASWGGGAVLFDNREED